MAKKKETNGIETPIAETENLFSKEQLLAVGKYKDKRDLLNAVLSDGKRYTFASAEQLLGEFMEREVN